MILIIRVTPEVDDVILHVYFPFSTCSDDSMGYQYPFTLRVVGKDGNSCAWCPWYRYDSS